MAVGVGLGGRGEGGRELALRDAFRVCGGGSKTRM